MAKALLGHLGSIPDQRLLEEITVLRSRNRLLQAELEQVRAERDAAESMLRVPDSPPLHYAPEPALA